jgi:calcium/calmodulin-dependent 3',5'-cyclic nucleotide phosphodiesterase
MLCVSEQGSLTIVRRSSTKKNQNHSGTVAGCPSSSSFADDEVLDAVDLDTDNLPAVDTPDACDKAAIRSVHHFVPYVFLFL